MLQWMSYVGYYLQSSQYHTKPTFIIMETLSGLGVAYPYICARDSNSLHCSCPYWDHAELMYTKLCYLSTFGCRFDQILLLWLQEYNKQVNHNNKFMHSVSHCCNPNNIIKIDTFYIFTWGAPFYIFVHVLHQCVSFLIDGFSEHWSRLL